MLGVQSMWTLNSGVFVEKMCKIRVKYVFFIETVNITVYLVHQDCPIHIPGLERSYICYVITVKSGNQFSTPNDQECVNIHYLSKMTKIVKIDLK